MRVITESEGAETVLDDNGSYWVRRPGAFFQIAGVSKDCPTEALLATVEDRLGNTDPKTLKTGGELDGYRIARHRIVDAQNALLQAAYARSLATRSPRHQAGGRTMSGYDEAWAASLYLEQLMRHAIPDFLRLNSPSYERDKPGIGDKLRDFAEEIDAAARKANPKKWAEIPGVAESAPPAPQKQGRG